MLTLQVRRPQPSVEVALESLCKPLERVCSATTVTEELVDMAARLRGGLGSILR